MLNYAVVGLNLGLEHVGAIMNNPRAELVACCDLDVSALEKARAAVVAAGRNPEQVFFTRKYEEILGTEAVDVVLIALPTELHAECSIKAMRAGKHVFCEKPLAETLENGRKICATVKETGRVFQLGYCVRSSAFNQKTLSIIRDGSIGRPVLVWYNLFCRDLNRSWRADRKLQGGKLFDCACHYLDMLGGWAGARVERVCAFGNPAGQKGPDGENLPDVATVMMEFENGVKGTLNLSQVTPNRQNATCGIAGTNGKIEADPYYPEGAGLLIVHAEGGLFKHTIEINGAMTSAGHLGFREQHDVFIDAVTRGSAPACSADEGLAVAQLMAAIDRSMAEGRVVAVSDMPCPAWVPDPTGKGAP